MDSGVHLAFGSDASITDFNPLLGIHAAIRADGGAISVDEAVRAYTLRSAFAEFQENVKGSVEVGKMADFVILSEDIFAVDASKILRAEVIITVVGGNVVFQTAKEDTLNARVSAFDILHH